MTTIEILFPLLVVTVAVWARFGKQGLMALALALSLFALLG